MDCPGRLRQQFWGEAVPLRLCIWARTCCYGWPWVGSWESGASATKWRGESCGWCRCATLCILWCGWRASGRTGFTGAGGYLRCRRAGWQRSITRVRQLRPQRLTICGTTVKLDEQNRGSPDQRECAAIRFCSSCWEVVQLVGLQTLDLAILVRVQASQPKVVFAKISKFSI